MVMEPAGTSCSPSASHFVVGAFSLGYWGFGKTNPLRLPGSVPGVYLADLDPDAGLSC